jgi:hypothetical protein
MPMFYIAIRVQIAPGDVPSSVADVVHVEAGDRRSERACCNEWDL